MLHPFLSLVLYSLSNSSQPCLISITLIFACFLDRLLGLPCSNAGASSWGLGLQINSALQCYKCRHLCVFMLFCWNRNNFPAADTTWCCLAKSCWEINLLCLPSLPQDKTQNCSISHLPKVDLSIQQPTFKKEGQWFIGPCWGSQWGFYMPTKKKKTSPLP